MHITHKQERLRPPHLQAPARALPPSRRQLLPGLGVLPPAAPVDGPVEAAVGPGVAGVRLFVFCGGGWNHGIG